MKSTSTIITSVSYIIKKPFNIYIAFFWYFSFCFSILLLVIFNFSFIFTFHAFIVEIIIYIITIFIKFYLV